MKIHVLPTCFLIILTVTFGVYHKLNQILVLIAHRSRGQTLLYFLLPFIHHIFMRSRWIHCPVNRETLSVPRNEFGLGAIPDTITNIIPCKVPNSNTMHAHQWYRSSGEWTSWLYSSANYWIKHQINSPSVTESTNREYLRAADSGIRIVFKPCLSSVSSAWHYFAGSEPNSFIFTKPLQLRPFFILGNANFVDGLCGLL